MNFSSHFNIRIYDSLIVTNLTGEWSQQDDLSYIASLAEKIDQLQRKPWGILVDMRGWIIHEGYIQPTFNITLDRFNQKAECWIVGLLTICSKVNFYYRIFKMYHSNQ